MFTFLLTCMYVGGLRAVLTETGLCVGEGQKRKKKESRKERNKERTRKEERKE